MGSDWVPMGSDVVRLGPMGSDWVISHTRHYDAVAKSKQNRYVLYCLQA